VRVLAEVVEEPGGDGAGGAGCQAAKDAAGEGTVLRGAASFLAREGPR
jgi:hypothetical protein